MRGYGAAGLMGRGLMVGLGGCFGEKVKGGLVDGAGAEQQGRLGELEIADLVFQKSGPSDPVWQAA